MIMDNKLYMTLNYITELLAESEGAVLLYNDIHTDDFTVDVSSNKLYIEFSDFSGQYGIDYYLSFVVEEIKHIGFDIMGECTMIIIKTVNENIKIAVF
jgi:hypothetical protein